jgi:hypothetical protein
MSALVVIFQLLKIIWGQLELAFLFFRTNKVLSKKLPPKTWQYSNPRSSEREAKAIITPQHRLD